ncbi:stage II sporulation protein R [Lentibacillus amyloliquefaciens]|uniref:Stage II sporulation protein R n=1 Tax=Lentibacillus amyloliquefaciens TaxID=1472767 RepID=A0A0U4FVT9_9BACI|nr:stage II sporulation protein R [Lentibacillus amyloliquefaciens]ALX49877.1 stage II sporulation protein R [Lentibacillus amyloliquefaciens]
MWKLAVSAIIIMIIVFAMPVKTISEEKGYSASSEIKVIPDEAIRLRILANSDSEKDQALKRKVRDEVNEVITGWVDQMTDINDARKLIEARIPKIRNIAGNVLKAENKEQTLEVEYGKNVTFPAKLYGSYMYPPGEYEAVLITLGEGKGSNWWCVLFPPLCFLDFSNGTSVAEAETADADEEPDEEQEEAEVKFFLFEWFS